MSTEAACPGCGVELGDDPEVRGTRAAVTGAQRRTR